MPYGYVHCQRSTSMHFNQALYHNDNMNEVNCVEQLFIIIFFLYYSYYFHFCVVQVKEDINFICTRCCPNESMIIVR